MSIADTISAFVQKTTLEDIPSNTIEFTKQLALKTMAGMVAGSATDSGRRMAAYTREVQGAVEAGVIGCGFRTSVEYAVLANGHFAHAAELEDDQFPSATSDITVFPVIFPLAEKLNLSGRKVVEASAIALEVMNRVGMFTLTSKGITDLPFYGVIGAAVVAAKALDLDAKAIRSAIGIAIGRASGFIANFGTDAHYLESAIACRDGYLAAVLAQKGMTGTANIEGWLTSLHGRIDLPMADIVKDLGKPRWHVHNIWVKKYPCCFLTHRQIDMLMVMKKEHGLNHENVESIELDVGPIDATCDRPSPVDVEDSRFSFQHILAGVLIDGDVNYGTFTEQKINDPLYKKVREKIKVNVHRNWPAEFNSGTARVVVTLKGGQQVVDSAEQPLGGPDCPLSREKFIELYEKYTHNYLGGQRIKETAEFILNLEKETDVRKLMSMVTNIR
ncbi:MmgE/PrpD family protein [Desulfofundulus thermosubterraneus]|uniref:2-methylcitrate dehydratase PrpD n=1 Tax=Desulfofundulus thermosubterraneus DSM 16057 TaxID=1121432 RepID=A0A1M6INK6_9FIRM|nr:MmgE/PrpD family protein [Desulfofundulus thermosubterraneus]SHJ36022.1 2-methylcitrate dehydratase PrpD [Desulfofundulus thermosubterraneus DSM 16057]